MTDWRDSHDGSVPVPELLERIQAAERCLREGGVVAFPTETVYGLGADAANPAAVRRIYEIKRRPADHPLIVHFADPSRLDHWARDIPDAARRLASRFWPGPLTLILSRQKHVPVEVTGGQDTVGLRVPDHPVALALLHGLGKEKALAAPSANRFGRISPTAAAHVRAELGDTVDMILDGGPCRVGLESTIVGFAGETPVLRRPGGISVAVLEDALGCRIAPAGAMPARIRASGTHVSHYAPATPLEVCPVSSLERRSLELAGQGMRVAVIGFSATSSCHVAAGLHRFPMPAVAAAYGRLLYAVLRQADAAGFDRILVEAPPEDGAWLAVADRLKRASWTTRAKESAI